MEPESSGEQADIGALVKAEQVRLSIEQGRRIPLPHFVLDACVAWTAWNVGLTRFALVWFVVMTFSQLTRTVHTGRLHKQGRLDPSTMLRILEAWLVVLGALHASLVFQVFRMPVSESHYILTMIMVGNAAGAVSPVAGHVRSYLSWAIVFGGTLVLCWLSTASLEGTAIALLLLLLFVVLTMYVRDQGRMLVQLITLSDSLRKERDRAERASAAKTRFFAAASHDLRQPLTALAYNAATVEVLASESGDETLTRVGSGIRRALAQARGLLDSLLEVSKLDAGVVEVSIESVDIAALLADVRDTYASAAAERGLTIRCEWEPTSPMLVDSDPAIVRRIVHNLVDNAIKFTHEGVITLAADPLSVHGVRSVRLRVSDTGQGIAVESQEQVFEEFFQVGNAERDRSKGLGLGLSIVRRLAALLGVRVSLSSTVGKGSSFDIVLPCGSAAPQPVLLSPARENQSGTAVLSHRALLIDDERDIRESLQTFLTTQGWQVVASPDLARAVKALREGFTPDAIVVDFRLRDGASGLDALAEIRRLGYGAPALLITGDTEPTRIAAARAAGVPVIYKPVDGMELARRLHAAVAAPAPASRSGSGP